MDKALAAATLIFLESIEWSKLIDGDYCCPSCEQLGRVNVWGVWKDGEHTNNCALKKLIDMYREIVNDGNQ